MQMGSSTFRTSVYLAVAAWLVGGGVCLALGQDVRLASGVVIKGEVIGSNAEGLEVKTGKGTKTYDWKTLSPATRYRYEPEYRANYEVVLRGLPPSRRTNPPLKIEDSQEDQSVEQTRTSAEKNNNKQPEKTLLLSDQIRYDNIDPLKAGEFPEVQLRAPDLTAYWGLQYGPKREEVLYMAFDTKGAEDIRDTMFLYGPADRFRKTDRIKGMKKRRGNLYTADFKKIDLSSDFGDIHAEFEVDLMFTVGQPKDFTTLVEVELSADNTSSSFLLYGQPTDLIYGEGTINVRGLLDLPVLWVSLDPASTSARIVGDLRMSRMKLCPEKGMDTEVTIEVYDENGNNLIDREKVDLDESMFEREYGIMAEMSDMKQGEMYRVKAFIDLGPFLGEVACEEMIQIPRSN
jgi:hypothetical protein